MSSLRRCRCKVYKIVLRSGVGRLLALTEYILVVSSLLFLRCYGNKHRGFTGDVAKSKDAGFAPMFIISQLALQ